MKFSNFLYCSKIAIYIALACTVFSLGYIALSLWGIKLRGNGLFLLPVVEGIGCVLLIGALITELIRYLKK